MKTRKICTTMILTMMILSGCGSKAPAEQAKREEAPYPEANAIVSSLEEAGYDVEESDSFEELGISVTRITAVNGEEYLDLCYGVTSSADQDSIAAYYTNTDSYRKYNLVSDGDTIYCYSSESVIESAGLQ